MTRSSLSWLGLVLLGCEPALPVPSTQTEEPPSIHLELSPAASPDAIAAVTHLRLVGAGKEGVTLVAGEVGPRQLDQIAEADLSKALAERIVPAVTWVEGDDAVVAPLVPLPQGERFDLVVAERELVFPLTVSATALAPLTRLFPPPGVIAGSVEVVFCAPTPLEPLDEEAALLPDGPRGRFVTRSPGGGGARCVRFVSAEAVSGEWMPPPFVGPLLPLEPAPIAVAEPTASPQPVSCDAPEIAIGPGCARIEDDRMVLRPPDAPVFWTISSEGLDQAFATDGGREVVVAGLTPDSVVDLLVETLDLGGAWAQHAVRVETLPPRPRFVLNEIYANPVGEEPEQEWIEIVNAGSASGDLSACTFQDIGGEVALPPAWIGPGAFVVVVNSTFDPASEYDPAPAGSATVLTVEKLGKNGLSNSGEPTKLVCDDGTVSRAPAEPKPKPGMSLARVTPGAPDPDPSSFELASPTPGAGN